MSEQDFYYILKNVSNPQAVDTNLNHGVVPYVNGYIENERFVIFAELNDTVTENEVWKALYKFKNDKSDGCDGLKSCGKRIVY